MMERRRLKVLLTVENLCLTYDKKIIFNHASFRVLPNEKIGVVGNNGVGKTTLIKILCGSLLADSGTIHFDKTIKVGYLDQYMNVDGNLSIDLYLKKMHLFHCNNERNGNE